MQLTGRETLVADRYHLRDAFGSGGMGTVYRADDRLTGEQVALKRVLAAADTLVFQSQNTVDTNDPRLALAHEFQVLSSLRHPHVIRVIDYGFDAEGQAFYTMTLLEAPQTILAAAEDQAVSMQIDLLTQMLLALDYIHRRDLLHRDLKPGNVLVKDGHVYVLDFGLAINSKAAERSNEIAGTLAYMAPEVLFGDAPVIASDLYAVGVMAYEIFGGKHPFESETATGLIEAIAVGTIDLNALAVDPAIVAVIGRLLARDPEDRYPSAYAVVRALNEAAGLPLPEESVAIRESYLQAADFVGRRKELGQLTTALQDVQRESSGSAWLIGGESGVGKSRFINEVATRAMVAGATLLRGQAVTGGGTSYQLWTDILRRLVLATDLEHDELDALSTILPGIESLVGEMPTDDDRATMPLADAQTRLPLILDALLVRVSAQSPIVLLLEDLQWAADWSVTMIAQLMQSANSAPLLIIGTFRDDERPDLPDVLPDAEVIHLERLEMSEIEQLSVAMLGAAGRQQQVVDLLHKETEGNVFFLVEVVRVLAEDAGRTSDIGKATLPEQIFSGGIQRVVEYRLMQLPDWARRAVTVAAIIGRQIDPDLMAALQPSLDIEAWLTVCTNVAVFSAISENYQFAHDKLREGVLEALLPDDKTRYHQQVGEAIETVYADVIDDYAAVLFGHFSSAGDRDREARYARLAGSQAFEINNYRDAKRLYSRALELTDVTANHNDETMAAIYLGLGKTCYGLSDYDESRGWCIQARDLYAAFGDEHGLSDAINCLGESDFRQARWDSARQLINESLAIRRRLGDAREIAYGLMNLGVIEAQTGDLHKAKDLFQECYDLMKTVGSPMSLARALNNLGLAYDMLGDPQAARERYQQSLEIRREINDKQGIAYSLANLSTIEDAEGNSAHALELTRESIDLLKQVGDKQAYAVANSQMAQLLLHVGDYDAAEQHEKEALIVRRKIAARSGEAASFNGLAEIARRRGNLDEAWGYARQALEIAVDLHQPPLIINILFMMARVFDDNGDTIRARTLLAVIQPLEFDSIIHKSVDEAVLHMETGMTESEINQAKADAAATSLDDAADAMLALSFRAD